VANALSDSLAEALISNKAPRLQPLFDRTSQDERLFAIGLCDPDGKLLQKTERFPRSLSCVDVMELAHRAEPTLALTGGQVLVGVHSVMGHRPAPPRVTEHPLALEVLPDEALAGLEAQPPAEVIQLTPVLLGRLVLLHDLSFIDRRSQDTRRYLIGLIAALGLVIAVITVVGGPAELARLGQRCARHHAGRGPAQPADAGAGTRAVCGRLARPVA
jgi:hypothetical protein